MLKKKHFIAPALAVPFALLMTGCSTSDLFVDKLDESTVRTADSSEKAVADGMVPEWIPAGGTNLQLVQRNTGSERIFVMDYDGKLENAKCFGIETEGKPTDAELAKAYGSDLRTKDAKPEEISKTRTLEADWWPADGLERTTDLCGRFWVHQNDGKLYYFGADSQKQVDGIEAERKAAENKK